jgi:hypothetical protein
MVKLAGEAGMPCVSARDNTSLAFFGKLSFYVIDMTR